MRALLSLNSQITKEDLVWGMDPLMKNTFKIPEEGRGSVPAKGYLFPISGPIFGLWPKSLCQNLSRNCKMKN